ncbi:elongation factor P [bacterium]|nr:elongation factor P [bacterium]
MLNYNDAKPGVIVLVEGEPYVVVWNNIMQKQQRRPVNQTKLRHLLKGNTIEYSFQQSDKLEEADVAKKEAIYIFTGKGEVWFHYVGDKSSRFSLPQDVVGEQLQWLKANTQVTILTFEDNPVAVQLPAKVELKVVEAPPNIKGNTAQGGNKVVTLETGATVNTPMFVEMGDVVRINTQTGEYVERA